MGLALLARLARRLGLSAMSLYLLGGLAFGEGGIAPLNLTKDFIHLGSEIGVLLLLFMLGLEYSGEHLTQGLRRGIGGAALDLLLNFPPGFIAGKLLGWALLPSILMGGITLVTSSGIVARLLSELGRTSAPETPKVLSILVLEDLMMAVYLPLMAVLLAGGGLEKILISVGVACAAVLIVLFIATRYGSTFSSFVANESDEALLLTIFGTVLLVAGIAQRLQVSAAIGAFLVGIAVSSPITERSHRLLTPLRDLSAATFFFFFGLEIDPRSLPPVLMTALVLAAVTAISKIFTGYWAARGPGLERRSRLRAGLTLVAHGEFSIVIAGLGASIEPRLGPLSAAYVLLLAIFGPILARVIH
ncbi:MAG TPA: cation:proton antiporter [Terracidiphilus sp.]|nr:cation:proton antiporter [Terracidiphilus sp.]